MPKARPGETATPFGTSPQQKRGVSTRSKVIRAAVQVFSRDTFEKARIDDVVKKAGVSRGTFFHYFPRKEDVLLALAAEEFSKVKQALEDSARKPESDTRHTLQAGFAAIADTAAPPHLFAAVVREVMSNRRRFEAMIGDGTPTYIEIMAEVLSSGQEKGEVRSDLPAPVLAVMINSMVFAPIVTFPNLPGVTMRSLVDMTETYLDLLWEGIQPHNGGS
ncbi:MAG: TetR/AcrR family transcriptional regulator [Candidatus Geothermincolia bacterium]